MKDLINIKNNSNKCFLIILVSYQTLKTHPERIARGDWKMVNDLDYEGIEFPVSENDYSKIEQMDGFIVNNR